MKLSGLIIETSPVHSTKSARPLSIVKFVFLCDNDNSQSSVLPHAVDYALAHSTDISNLGRDSHDFFAFRRQLDGPTSAVRVAPEPHMV